jgi:monofunctional biosynthetic peptidoglycan transglycosylase
MAERAWESPSEGWPAYDPVPIEQIPRHVVQAALTAEDQRFLEHDGFDFDAIEKAWAHNRSGGTVRGASTISQQVARNVWLWQERTWLRKGLEAWYTVWLELLVPKERILELYLNVAEMGPMTFGVEAAAQKWYGKPASRLTRTEAATIVAMLPSPRKRTPGTPYVQRKAGWIVRNAVELPKDFP